MASRSMAGRQDREYEILNRICTIMPVGQEQRIFGVGKLGLEGIANETVNNSVKNLERLGIVSRRMEFNAMRDDGTVAPARSWHWTLLMDKDAAIEKLKEFHAKEMEAYKFNRGTSLKDRILAALLEKQQFGSVPDILHYIAKPGENLDPHNITHNLRNLKDEGKVTFKAINLGTSKRKKGVPVDIRVAKGLVNGAEQPKVEPEVTPEPTTFETSIGTYKFTPTEPVSDYPIAKALASRRDNLMSLAREAEANGQDDIALMLMERAEAPFTPEQEEMVRMFNALKECK